MDSQCQCRIIITKLLRVDLWLLTYFSQIETRSNIKQILLMNSNSVAGFYLECCYHLVAGLIHPNYWPTSKLILLIAWVKLSIDIIIIENSYGAAIKILIVSIFIANCTTIWYQSKIINQLKFSFLHLTSVTV